MTAVDLDSSVLTTTVAFTGRLATMARATAFDIVRERGGTPSETVNKRTAAVIVGELGWPLMDDGRPSNKLDRARSYGIPVVTERRFLEWIGQASPNGTTATYTAEQVSTLSKLPRERVEELAALGLLPSQGGRFGFQAVASARQIAKLFQHGVPLSVIIKSLHEIRAWLPDAAVPNLQVVPGRDGVLVRQAEGFTDKRGQFVLPVEGPSEDPDSIFERATRAEAAGDLETAERLYRALMRLDPRDPAPAFNLGNLLRSAGRPVEAEAAYRGATRASSGFAEAWFNLASLQDDQGRAEEALRSLDQAVKSEPDYADAHFNLALILQRTNRHEEAAQHWRRYLALDGHSSWAGRARKSLKYCETAVQAALLQEAN